MEKLDKIDRRILYELDRDCRQPISNIAKSIKKSKQFVEYRTKKLEETGILKGYNTVLDLSKVGYIAMRVYLKFQNLTPQAQQELIKELANDKETWWVVILEGHWDVGIAVAVTHIYEFYDYWEKVLQRYNKYIKERSLEVYSHIAQYPKAYLLDKKNFNPPLTIFAAKKPTPIDELDKNIINAIATNARAPIIQLAKTLQINHQTVKARLKKLEENKIIVGYRANINFLTYGYRYYKAYLKYYDTTTAKQLEEQYCKTHPNILNTNKVIGRNEFEIEIQVKDFQEFEEVLNDIRKKFPELISSYETITAKEEIKYQFFPK